MSPALIRERLDYWTLLLGPKFSAKERKHEAATENIGDLTYELK
jgi:hypothetical protein